MSTELEQAAIELVQQAMASGAASLAERLPEFRAHRERPMVDFFEAEARSFVGVRRDLIDPLTGTDPDESFRLMQVAILGSAS